jgi:arylsulfatase A-like enzyme
VRGARLGSLALAALASCGAEPLPDVVLVVLDTVRADRLSLHGHDVRTSPELDAFAAGATRFDHAIATAPWTVPSHASMFTGLDPYEHGAHTFPVPEPVPNVPSLSDEATTLAELLADLGYETGGFAANHVFLSERYNLHQGFATWRAHPATAADVNRFAVLPWLAERDERPLLLFVNYMDAHRPYNSAERPGLLPRPVGDDSAELIAELLPDVLTGRGGDPAKLERLADQYDTAIANMDAALGELLGELRAAGRFEDALVIVTSDHGEYLGERDLLEHSKDVYQGALHVPLVVKAPGQTEGDAVAEPISLTAIPHLVAAALPERARAELERRLPPDRSHRPLAENHYARPTELFDQPWGDRFHRVRRAVFADGWKYVHSSDGAHELYRLDEDGREGEELSAVERERAERMRLRLERLLSRPRARVDPGPPPGLDEAALRDLEALGY